MGRHVRRSRARHSRQAQRGFTLIELMIVVGIIAILAAVVIPGFFKETRKAKSTTEVNAMFAELMTREEQYKVDVGSYRAAAACPATPSAVGNPSAPCVATGTDWQLMRVNPTVANLYCSYTITAGVGTGTNNPSGFAFTSPASGWYYILATCDMDGVAAVNATYFTSSMNASIQKLNEGR